MDSIKWQWFAGGFAAGVVIIGAAWLIMGGGASSKVSVDTAASSTAPTTTVAVAKPTPVKNPATMVTEAAPITASGETVTAEDQSAGMTAMIASVSVMHPTWVAVKDTNGRVLGARRADASTENLVVSLLRATVPGQTYQAVLYVDNGDRVFNLHSDTLVVGSESAPVGSTFTAR